MNTNLNIKSCNNSSNTYKKQSGFSLIEVMVAALILSIGILGVAGLQILGLKGTSQSYMKQQAMSVVHSLAERMRSNAPGVVAGNYTMADSSTFDCNTAPACTTPAENCNSTAIANLDLHNTVCGYQRAGGHSTGGVQITNANDTSSFVNGKLRISCPGGNCAAGDIRIALEWQEQAFGQEDRDGDLDGIDDVDTLVINTRILP